MRAVMEFLSEAELEQALREQLHELGYQIEREENIGPDGRRPERESHDVVVLKKTLGASLRTISAWCKT